MTTGAGDLSFQLRIHPPGFWLAAPVDVPGFRTLRLVLDTGSPVNSLIKPIATQLLERGVIKSTGASYARSPIYRVSGAQIQGQVLPDLDVHVSNRATLIGIDGILGLDFLRNFRHIALDVPTLQLTLHY